MKGHGIGMATPPPALTTAVEVTPGMTVRFPKARQVDGDISQDEEFCIVEKNGKRQQLRFHDYDKVYKVPGLYEHLFYDTLKCQSPEVVCGLLADQLGKSATGPDVLRVLDVGAGNGMIGEELADLGVGHIVGVDIIPEAAEATWRDRPDVYADYHVVDLTNIPAGVDAALTGAKFNALVTVAALGFGDIPPLAFANAFNYVADHGWVAFNIRDIFVKNDAEPSGFCRLIERMSEEGVLDIRVNHKYRHRYNIRGEALHYHALVGVKKRDVPAEWADA